MIDIRRFAFVPVALAASLLGCGGSSPAGATPPSADSGATDAKLSTSLAGKHRPAEESVRDKYRHPKDTLQFFGLRDDMNVVELAPGAGWYTAVLAPVLHDHGSLSITSSDPNGDPASESTKNAKSLQARFAANPELFGNVKTLIVKPKEPMNLGPDGSADLVLTFRSLHGWISRGSFGETLTSVSKVLKKGGTFGVVEHRAKADGSTDPKAIGDSGYVPEDMVIKTIEAAGFKLVAKSEVNANPKDTKDYPKGVWTLPPTYELKDVDHAKYEAIGESDRMTLKFAKQ